MKKGSSSTWYFILFISLAIALGGFAAWKNLWFSSINASLSSIEEHYSKAMELNGIFQSLTVPALLSRDVPGAKKDFFDHTQKQIDLFKETFKELHAFKVTSLEKTLEETEKEFNAYYPFLLELAYYKKTGDHKNETDPAEIERLENLENKVLLLERTINELIRAITHTFEKEQKNNIEQAQHQIHDTNTKDIIWGVSIVLLMIGIPFLLNMRLFKPLDAVKKLAANIKSEKFGEKYTKQKGLTEIKIIQECLLDAQEKLMEGKKASARVDFVNNHVLRHSVILRRDLRISNIGEKMAKVLGYTPQDLESNPLQTILRSSNQAITINAESYEGLGEIECELVRKNGTSLAMTMVVKLFKEDEKIKYIYLTMKPPKALVKSDSEKKYLKAIDMLTASNMRLRQENEKLNQKIYAASLSTTNPERTAPISLNDQVSQWLEAFMAESKQVFTSRTRFNPITPKVNVNPDILHTTLNRCAREILDKIQIPYLSVETGLVQLNKEANHPSTGLFTAVIISATNKPFNLLNQSIKPVSGKWAQNFSNSQKGANIYSNNNINNLYYAILFENEPLEITEEPTNEIVIH